MSSYFRRENYSQGTFNISNIDGTIVPSVSFIPFILLIAKSELFSYIVALATILSYIFEQAVFMLG